MEKTWRWFGPSDPISLKQIKQIGVEGIVTALHHIPNGELWSQEEILVRKREIERWGMTWSVVESLPVSEGIKTRSSDWGRLISNYRTSLQNLSACGISCVCYNFMPVLDWVRTDLAFPTEAGTSMAFDPITFAAFDVFILKRPKAEESYSGSILQEAEERVHQMSKEAQEALAYSTIVHTQAFIDGAIDAGETNYKEKFLEVLAAYSDLGEPQLRSNLFSFLEAVIPIAETLGIRLAIHPDDPPFSVLGLPRIVSTAADLEATFSAVPSVSNGLTFCTGSLGARKDNNLLDILRTYSHRIHFAHLRNLQYLDKGVFYESGHLDGVVDMGEVVKGLLQEEYRRQKEGRVDARIPMRPDHGLMILDDETRNTPPGYPLLGRMKGLAELVGLESGILRELEGKE